MKGVISGSSTVRLAPWGPGEPVDHRRLNQTNLAVEKLAAQVNKPRQVLPGRTQISVSEFTFVSDEYDYFLATPSSDLGTDSVAIAKPYTLRALLSRGTVTFVYTTPQLRTATEGAEEETQVLVPTYSVGDIIYAMRSATSTGITSTSPNGEQLEVVWVDLNTDGRQWAKQAE